MTTQESNALYKEETTSTDMQSKINKINKIILLSIPGVKRLPEVQKLKQLNLCEYDLKELTKHAYFSIILLDHEMSSTLMRFC